MRAAAYILLVYFPLLYFVPLTGVHVHHVAGGITVSHSSPCNDGGGKCAGAEDGEDLAEHLFENGCIVAGASDSAMPSPDLCDFDAEPVLRIDPAALFFPIYDTAEVSFHFVFYWPRGLRAPPVSA